MPPVTYMNPSTPFHGFLASFEQQGSQCPLFSQTCETGNQHGHEPEPSGHSIPQAPFTPCTWDHFPGGPFEMPRRGPPQRPSENHRDNEGKAEKVHEEKSGDKNVEMNNDNAYDNDNGEGPSCKSEFDNEGGRSNRYGQSWSSGFDPRHNGHRRGPHCHGPGPHGHHHGGRRSWDHRSRHGPRANITSDWAPFDAAFNCASPDPSSIATHFWNLFNNGHTANTNNKHTPDTTEDHCPDADVFNTDTAFVVHISLPGAKKEDVGVNWDADKGELSVAGVIYRPGDEEFIKTLAVEERKVGPFERKIRLGTGASPAHVDVDGITAKLEDGVLRVEVPKLDSGYVDVRKVDVE
ncbi:hypothetical protein IAQ61_005235 [Plenodomus lingam]|uniref:uncharacterized protein n=1 Tax=Leptosphaeria maculans TaxID=5022 RepID=UPI0033221FC4|nr:hypothetical protein IAQ61_005235 [Plenodomus lingam]